MGGELRRLAAGCLFPGFPGATPPDWVRRALQDGLGGVVLYGRNVVDAVQLRALTAALRRERAETVIAIDEEGGDVTRLEAAGGSSYPGNAALGAVDDPTLTEQVAVALGADLAAAGVTLNLAPVADVNTNPVNPIIGVRSFGSDPELVARHVSAFVRGLRAAGVEACAKHFPGHGDTDADSHLELPRVDADRETLLARELVPFRAAIEAGAGCVMTAHVVVSELDSLPATLSPRVLHDLLRDELGFRGAAMTDALEMRAIAATTGLAEAAVSALAAGADALCLGHDPGEQAVEDALEAIVDAVRSGRLPEDRLREAASRVGRLQAPVPAADRRGSGPGREVGARAARRALRAEGSPALAGAALVVGLEQEPSVAAGPGASPAATLARLLPDARYEGLAEGERAGSIAPGERQLVLVVRDAHRHPWQRSAVEALLEGVEDGVVVEVGLPVWRPARAAAYVATYGAARVNLEAAAEVLVG